MSAVVFENTRRQSDKAPIHNGTIRVSLDELQQMPVVMVADKDGKMHRCVDLDISLWSRAKGDLYFFSGMVKKKYVRNDGSGDPDISGAQKADYRMTHSGRDGASDFSNISDGSEYMNQETTPTEPPATPENDLPF